MGLEQPQTVLPGSPVLQSCAYPDLYLHHGLCVQLKPPLLLLQQL
jgi:hypothetical protein